MNIAGQLFLQSIVDFSLKKLSFYVIKHFSCTTMREQDIFPFTAIDFKEGKIVALFI